MRQTTNYGLKITEGNDDWRNIFDDNAYNMDAIDDAIAPMTGATVSSDGTSGVVPEPESGDQNKFLKGDASWAIPGVMTVNGRSPDASGNITVIEGGGSSSYGSYRLDATIPVSAWTGDGPYVATVSNQYITASMDGTETWLDDETAMLGDTTFTTSDGLLTISTTEKPATAWGLHIALAVNGADVLADISSIREDVDDNTTAITGLSTNKAYQISIANTDAIAAVYEKLNALTNGTTATVYIGGTAMSNLTNSAYSSAATGTVGKVTSSNYRFNLSWGTSTAYDVSSTLGHGTAITASSLSALKTNLLSVANKADVNGFIAVKITPSFTSDGFTSGSNYGGHIYNIYKSNGSTTYFSAIVSNNLGEDVLIGYSNGTWYFNSPKKNIDTLNSKFAWNALSPVTGTTQMTLPDQTQAKEFIFIARYGTSQELKYLVFSFPIPNLTDIRDFTFTQGYALANGNGFAQVMFNGSSHKANLVNLTISGTDYTSTSQLMCFYR